MDDRDRLILSLCTLLRAERETRSAFEAVINAGQLSPEVLTAIVADPVPAITQDDILRAETIAAELFHAPNLPDCKRPSAHGFDVVRDAMASARKMPSLGYSIS